MTSPLFIPRLIAAAAGGLVLALLGALAHQLTLFGDVTAGWRGLGIPYGIILATSVLVLWVRRVRYTWGAAAAGILAVSWASGTLLLASSSTDVLIAPNMIGTAHMVAGASAALVAAGWPVRH